jgi:hypothetical protein
LRRYMILDVMLGRVVTNNIILNRHEQPDESVKSTLQGWAQDRDGVVIVRVVSARILLASRAPLHT